MNPILISGVPACGKTSFGNYLRDQHGFLHIDLEARAEHRHALHRLWEESQHYQRVGIFFDDIRKIHPKCIVTWGIPVNYLFAVNNIKAAGVDCWWFDGDLKLAEAEWTIREGRSPMGPEREQFDRLPSAASVIRQLFGQNIITTLSHSGRTSNEDIYAHIFRTSVRE